MWVVQAGWNPAVLIAAITTVGTILTGVVGIFANIVARKLGVLQVATSSALDAHEVATREEWSTVRADIATIRGEIAAMHEQGTDAGIKLAASVMAELENLRADLHTLRAERGTDAES